MEEAGKLVSEQVWMNWAMKCGKEHLNFTPAIKRCCQTCFCWVPSKIKVYQRSTVFVLRSASSRVFTLLLELSRFISHLNDCNRQMDRCACHSANIRRKCDFCFVSCSNHETKRITTINELPFMVVHCRMSRLCTWNPMAQSDGLMLWGVSHLYFYHSFFFKVMRSNSWLFLLLWMLLLLSTLLRLLRIYTFIFPSDFSDLCIKWDMFYMPF